MSDIIEPSPSGAIAGTPPPIESEQPQSGNVVELLLRNPDGLLARFEGREGPSAIASLATIALAGYFVYGLVVASFAGGMQWWASPLKIAAGVALCAAICFPSLYILVCLSGARARLLQVSGILLSVLALSAVFLAGFAPIAWVFSQSSSLVSFIAALHLLMWLTSIFASARVLFIGMKRWKARATEWAALWLLVLLVTALQMETVLRPIVGPATHLFEPEKKFFLQHWVQTVSDETMGKD
jgi:hypothetical protein